MDANQPIDTLTLTLRLHDPKEKKNAKLAASWVIVQVPRADLTLSPPEFAAKHLIPAVEQLEHFTGQRSGGSGTAAAPAPATDPPATSSDQANNRPDPDASALGSD